jgi:3-methyladenine DNA glycosylase/8-oxoguanine DNA glycosylase
MNFFPYGELEINYLKQKDKKLGDTIDQIGLIHRELTPDPFTALTRSIVAQQISSKAAQTVWGRVRTLVGELTPENLGAVDQTALQQCGMSMQKAGYIKGIAHAALTGAVDFPRLDTLPDNEVINQLVALNGVGVWTAEMLLLFSLGRPDILSYNDLAIRRGLMMLHGLREISRSEFEKFRILYSPHGSVASLYLWALSVL